MDNSVIIDEVDEPEYSHDFVQQFKLELAMRPNHDYVGSKMGGDPSQFFYFLTHDVAVEKSPDSSIRVYQRDNKVVFVLPTNKNFKLKDIRLAFNKFWETCPDKNEYTEEQLTNTSFVNELRLTNPDAEIHLLFHGLNIAYDLVKWLDQEAVLMKQIKDYFKKEFDYIRAGFLTEMQLPVDYFVKLEELRKSGKHLKPDPMSKVLANHPIWGKKWEDVEKREKLMLDATLSQDDLDKLNKIGSLPSYLNIFIARTVITLDRMIKHNIDERVEFLGRINEEVNSLIEAE
jgi:hypothetical protein